MELRLEDLEQALKPDDSEGGRDLPRGVALLSLLHGRPHRREDAVLALGVAKAHEVRIGPAPSHLFLVPQTELGPGMQQLDRGQVHALLLLVDLALVVRRRLLPPRLAFWTLDKTLFVARL